MDVMRFASKPLKYSFSQSTINVWNKLAADCAHASSVNSVQEQNRQVSHRGGLPLEKGQVTLRIVWMAIIYPNDNVSRFSVELLSPFNITHS